MFGWLSKRAGAADGPSAGPAVCSFCKKTQLAVRKVIAGPDAMICDECVVLCMTMMSEGTAQGADDEGPAFFYLGALVDRMRTELDETLAASLADAALALAGHAAIELRRLAALAFDVGRYRLAVDAQRRIETSGRTFSDDSTLASALYQLGAFEEAAAAIAGAAPVSEMDRAWHALTRIAVQLRVDSNLDIVSLERMLTSIDEAADVVGEANLGTVNTPRAECLLRVGQPQMAMRALRTLGEPEQLDLLQSMLFGDAHLALGERGRALEWFRRADEKKGPARLRGEARVRLGRVSSDPYR